MASKQASTALYPHPFSKAYWRDAAAELKSTKMLVVTALMIAIRIALKPFAIPIFGDIKVQTAMLATALGAMIYGPVVAIPSAIISDTIGFMLFPSGDYFFPFVFAEIAGTMIFSLLLYRSEVTPFRIMWARFFICLIVNVIMMQLISAWQYTYMGNPEKAKSSVMQIMSGMRILKNVCFFPVETVILTLFMKYVIPVARRAGLTSCSGNKVVFNKKFVITLSCLFMVGCVATVGYFHLRYNATSRSADYTPEQRVEANQEMTQLILDKTDDWDDQTVVCIVDSAYRPLFGKETDYTVSVYVLDQAAFDAAVEATKDSDEPYTMDTLWGYSKSGPKNDDYKSLVKVATVTFTEVEDSGEILEFTLTPVE